MYVLVGLAFQDDTHCQWMDLRTNTDYLPMQRNMVSVKQTKRCVYGAVRTEIFVDNSG